MVDKNVDEEEEKKVLRHSRRLRFLRYAYAQVAEAFGNVDEPFYYLLDGVYHNGIRDVPVQISGSSLEDCVSRLKLANPTLGLDRMSFTGGWVCADYDVTKQVYSLV